MTDDLFREGGPLNTRRTGSDEYEMNIILPIDEDGMLGRECTDSDCSPGYFKVKPGTGIVEDHQQAFCPYCRTPAEPDEFLTEAQQAYAIALVEKEAIEGADALIKGALGLGASGKKKIGGDFISVEMSYKPSRPKPVSRPTEEELRRDVLCPHCGLEHAVFGLATWCADCGRDIFLTHLSEEFEVIDKIIAAVNSRREDLGKRVAARDIENSLEDLVSIFEAVLKLITRRQLAKTGKTDEQVASILKTKVRTRYQSVQSASTILEKYIGVSLAGDISEDDVAFLAATFEKRHPITHNLGIVDRMYLERARTGELEGREIRVSEMDVSRASEICVSILANVYSRVFSQSDSDLLNG